MFKHMDSVKSPEESAFSPDVSQIGKPGERLKGRSYTVDTAEFKRNSLN